MRSSAPIIAGQQPKALPPAFNPAANPYAKGIYANGIIESVQAQGENINIYPEVAGPITQVLVAEGATVRKGDLLLTHRRLGAARNRRAAAIAGGGGARHAR